MKRFKAGSIALALLVGAGIALPFIAVAQAPSPPYSIYATPGTQPPSDPFSVTFQTLAPGANVIINPSMDYDQANNGTAVTLPNSATANNTLDGWRATLVGTAANVTVQRVADAPPGFTNSLKVTIGTGAALAASDFLAVSQSIESTKLAGFSFGVSGSVQRACASFWAKSSIANFTTAFGFLNHLQNVSYAIPFTIPTANTWTFVALPCILTNAPGTWIVNSEAAGAFMQFTMGAGTTFLGAGNQWNQSAVLCTTGCSAGLQSVTGASFNFTNVKLENSITPTAFRPDEPSIALTKVQRYYETSYSNGVTPGTASTTAGQDAIIAQAGGTSAGKGVSFKTSKRCDAVMAGYSPSTGTVAKARDTINAADVNVTFSGQGRGGFVWSAPPSAGTSVNLTLQWTADCRI